MKKGLSLVLVLVVLLQLWGCGGADRTQELELFKQTYQDVNSAYENVEAYGIDIYEAWRIAIYESDDLSFDYLAKELSLNLDDLIEGSVYATATMANDVDYESMSEDDKETIRGAGDLFFTAMTSLDEGLPRVVVLTVVGAYTTGGKAEEIEEALNSAKESMKLLSQNYSDSEYYDDIKNFYTTTQSFYDFCKEPVSSFEQLKTTLNDYRNDIREYKNRLDFVFEEE